MNTFSLSRDLLEHLNNKGLFSLSQIVDNANSSIWRKEWFSWEALALDERYHDEWGAFHAGLLNSHIHISNEPDKLRWVHSQIGFYSPKKGYDWLMS